MAASDISGNDVGGAADALVLVELTGPNVYKELRLTAQALPIGPLSVVGKMRAEFTRYPGTRDATVQVLGPDEGQTTITGRWATRSLAPRAARSICTYNYSEVDTAAALVEIVDGIRRRGQLVSLQWGALVRTGVLIEFEQRWKRSDELEWSLTFEWASLSRDVTHVGGSTTGYHLSIKQAADDAYAAAAYLVQWCVDEQPEFVFPSAAGGSALLPAVSEYAKSLNAAHALFDALENAVGGVAESSMELRAAADQVKALGTRPVAVARQAAAALHNVDSAAATLRDVPEGILYDSAAVAFSLGGSMLGRGVAQVLWWRAQTSQAQRMRLGMAPYRRTFNSLGSTGVLAVYIARDGDDLRDVSRIYYGSTEDWRAIKDFNELADSELETGQRIYIPLKAAT